MREVKKQYNEKNDAENSEAFASEQKRCAEVLAEERIRHVQMLKQKLSTLPKSSKQWWRINRELLNRKGNLSSIPTLRVDDKWLSDAREKANVFARTFASKSVLPPDVVDTPFFGNPDIEMDHFVAFRSRCCARLFKQLDPTKATGHDKISAAILKRLHKCLAVPFTRLCRRLFFEGCWPSAWKHHLAVPIFKRGAAFKPDNYRGVHLTTVLSKVAEKMVGLHLSPFLQRHAFGANQWAFSTGLSARDLVTMLMMSWILVICTGKKVGAYLSDISGAFDRVFKPYLLAKLHACGVGASFLNFLDAYLAPRTGQVLVQGSCSDCFEIDDSVFQGTVLGPPLWNTFFADVSAPASSTGGRESIFADDLNVFQEFDRLLPLTECQDQLGCCKARVHNWGRTNRVSFDASKEHVIILHPATSFGESFKLLGCMVDVDLRMHSAIEQVLSKIRPKITAILRTRGYYSTADLILQFKTHIWGLIEANMGGYFHAAASLLEKVDHAQNRFLRELGLSPADAFLGHAFAPPSLRRNIGILGLLHKRVLGKCHPSFERLLPWWSSRFSVPRGLGHDKQLYGHWVEISHHRAIYQRSIFCMVYVYNNLSQDVVDSTSVNVFQHALTQIVRSRCQRGDVDWTSSFSLLNSP